MNVSKPSVEANDCLGQQEPIIDSEEAEALNPANPCGHAFERNPKGRSTRPINGCWSQWCSGHWTHLGGSGGGEPT